MKIAIIGYGKMGKEIETLAVQKGHVINVIIDMDNPSDFKSEKFRTSDVAIEFSSPVSATGNILRCFDESIPVVTGTTGWYNQIDEITNECNLRKQALFYSPNFSIGMNIFFELNRHLASVMNNFPDYEPEIEEIHHIHKIDSPSGTAINLANDILSLIERKSRWTGSSPLSEQELYIRSVREGEITGTHTINYESSVDCIEIKHRAKNRTGLALGALLAAEFLPGKTGVFTMKDLLALKNVK